MTLEEMRAREAIRRQERKRLEEMYGYPIHTHDEVLEMCEVMKATKKRQKRRKRQCSTEKTK